MFVRHIQKHNLESPPSSGCQGQSGFLCAKHFAVTASLSFRSKDERRFGISPFNNRQTMHLKQSSRKHSTEQQCFGSAFSLCHPLVEIVLRCRICVVTFSKVVRPTCLDGTPWCQERTSRVLQPQRNSFFEKIRAHRIHTIAQSETTFESFVTIARLAVLYWKTVFCLGMGTENYPWVARVLTSWAWKPNLDQSLEHASGQITLPTFWNSSNRRCDKKNSVG